VTVNSGYRAWAFRKLDNQIKRPIRTKSASLSIDNYKASATDSLGRRDLFGRSLVLALDHQGWNVTTYAYQRFLMHIRGES